MVFHPDSAIDIVVATATTGEMASPGSAAQKTTNDDVDVSNKTKDHSDLSTLTSISTKRKDGEANRGVTPYVFYCLLLLMLSNLILQV